MSSRATPPRTTAATGSTPWTTPPSPSATIPSPGTPSAPEREAFDPATLDRKRGWQSAGPAFCSIEKRHLFRIRRGDPGFFDGIAAQPDHGGLVAGDEAFEAAEHLALARPF